MATPALAAGTRRVREAATLAEVVGQYVRLKPAGAGRLAGLCPFHQEKSPSFTVSTVKQLYHCFGCGAGGDVLSFVMRIEGLSFMEARRTLAEQYGVVLDDRPLTRQELAAQARQRVYAERLAADAAVYWQVVRERYQQRFETLKALMWGCAERDWEAEYQTYARRAWRWGKILRRLEAMDPVDALRKFRRVRMRLPVVALVDRERVLQAEEKGLNDLYREWLREQAREIGARNIEAARRGGYKDPDEFIRKFGAAAYKLALDRSGWSERLPSGVQPASRCGD